MSAAQMNPANGAVSFPTTTPLVADFGSFDVSQSQQAESVAAYGAAVEDPWRGSATPHFSISTAGFAKAHAANTSPFLSGGGLTDPDGASGTFTIDTGVTIAAPMIVTSMRLSHARLRATIPISAQLEGAGDSTVTWPTS